jgi:hypothetical protein
MSNPISTPPPQEVNTTKPQRRGRKLSDRDVQTIYRLVCEGKSNRAIEQETGIGRDTIAKYRNKTVESVPSTPMNEKALEVRRMLLSNFNANLEETLTKSMALLDTFEDRLAEKVLAGDIPETVTPLQVKQLIEGKATLLRLPGDLNQGRRDIYKQIQQRDNEITDVEYEELGEAGDLG